MNCIQNALIIGAGGHSRVVISILREMGVAKIEGVLDLSEIKSNEFILGVPVIGSVALLENLNLFRGLNFYLAIGDNVTRRYWYEKLICQNFHLPNLISPHAVVDPSAILGVGNIICANSFIGPDAKIEDNNLINTGAIVEHEVQLGSHCHLAPSSTIAGRTQIYDECFIGAGSTVINGIRVESGTTLGAGAVLIDNITTSGGVYTGVPAKRIGGDA